MHKCGRARAAVAHAPARARAHHGGCHAAPTVPAKKSALVVDSDRGAIWACWAALPGARLRLPAHGANAGHKCVQLPTRLRSKQCVARSFGHRGDSPERTRTFAQRAKPRRLRWPRPEQHGQAGGAAAAGTGRRRGLGQQPKRVCTAQPHAPAAARHAARAAGAAAAANSHGAASAHVDSVHVPTSWHRQPEASRAPNNNCGRALPTAHPNRI